jgi:proline-specific peptidase
MTGWSLRGMGIAVVIAFGATSACSHPAARTTAVPGEGMLQVEGGRIWYKVSGGSNGTPLVLIHGGPGIPSYYLKPLEALANERQVVRYDQLGAGKADHVTDTALFNIPRFVRELEALRVHLGYRRMHLLGHSWGTIVAVEYYRAHPEHVASMTLAGAFLDLPAWTRNTRRLVLTLSDSAQRAIRAHESDGNFDAPDYKAADDEYMSRYVMHHRVAADDDSIGATMNAAIYGYMQGPSEFTIVGTLKNYDITPALASVKAPTLYTVGEFDEADSATVQRFTNLTPGARMVVFQGAAHVTTWDAPHENIRVVRAFLREADSLARRR